MQILKMDFQSQSAPPIVPVMQSDSQSRFIGMALYNGGVPYEAPEGAVYTVQYRGPGPNNIGWYDTIHVSTESHPAVTVDDASKHIITLELAPQALQRAGDVHVNLCVLADGGYTLRTFDIIARVNAAAYPDEVAVTSYFYLVDIRSASWLSYLTACQEAQQAAQQAAGTAETAASSAKSSSDSAGTAADNAQEALKNVAQYVGGNIVGGDILTLQAAQWTQTTGAYPWTYTAPLTACKSSYLPTAVVVPDSISVAYAAGLSWTCESLDGSVQFWSKNRPTKDVDVQVSLLIPKNTQSTSILGSAILGQVELG